MTEWHIPIYERLLDDLADRADRHVKTERIVLEFTDWERLVMMIGASTATTKVEYGKLTWLTKYGEVVCTPGEVTAPRYEP